MKPGIHPENYRLVVFKDMSNDYTFITKSCVETKETIKWEDGNEYPVVLRNELVDALPSMKTLYPDHKSYAGQTMNNILTEKQRSSAHSEEATELASVILWNKPEGVEVEELPLRAQLAPMYGIWSGDISGNGTPELILGGNLRAVKPLAGPYLSSYGTVLSLRDGKFMSVDPHQSGLSVKGEIRGIERINSKIGKDFIVIARNNDSPVILQVQRE
jgi:ribosomal protein L31